MSTGGYAGRVLEVDLTRRAVSLQEWDAETQRQFLGGAGLAAKVVWDCTDAKIDPFAPENPLIFAIGPLTGASMPESSRYVVAGLSPLTGIWGEAHSGGDWGDALKHAGCDAVIVRGQAEKPVYLWVHDGEAEIRDAGHLWGTDTYDVDAPLRGETEEKASIACIGRAGEKLARIACVMNDGPKGRAAARCGLGALMGAKKLKAIAVRGTLPIKINDERRFREGVRRIQAAGHKLNAEEENALAVRQFKTMLGWGTAPIKNWREGTFEPLFRMPETLRGTKPLHCQHCPYSCYESRLTPEGDRHMLYQLWGPMGGGCLIGDADALQAAYALCNRYGLDTSSTSNVVAFAMECFEKGLITTADSGGIELTWGNASAMVELVRQIGEREGLGRLLGEGVKRAADEIGGLAPEYAMHVKGLEFPSHDPRASLNNAIGYATASLGACHQEYGVAMLLEGSLERPERQELSATAVSYLGELGFTAPFRRGELEGRGAAAVKLQNLHAVVNSLVICRFLQPKWGIAPSLVVELLNAATGWETDLADNLRVGERISNLKRMLLVRRGISRKDDTLPARMLTHKLPSGGAAGVLPHLGPMLSEYYEVRGWTEEGVPSEQKLRELDLEFCLS